MKTMTCKQLGGACNKQFQADTFDEIAEMSKQHGMEMYQSGDAAHLKAMQEMQKLMKSPEDMQTWIAEKKKEFNNLQGD